MDTVGQHFRFIGEQRSKEWGKNDHRCHQDQAVAMEMNNATVVPFLARFILSAPRFCPTKVVTARPILWIGSRQNLSSFSIGCPASHAGGAEMVDIGLNKYIGKRSNSDLKSCRKANTEDRHGSSFVDMQVFPN